MKASSGSHVIMGYNYDLALVSRGFKEARTFLIYMKTTD